jgi:hypothetical protein
MWQLEGIEVRQLVVGTSVWMYWHMELLGLHIVIIILSDHV